MWHQLKQNTFVAKMDAAAVAVAAVSVINISQPRFAA